jgi:hypothetical protein
MSAGIKSKTDALHARAPDKDFLSTSIRSANAVLAFLLILSFIFLMLFKHSMLYKYFDASVLQDIGILLLIALWIFIVLLGKLKVDRSVIVAVAFIILILPAYIYSDIIEVRNFINSAFVFLSFPIAITISNIFARYRINICGYIVYAIFFLTLVGAYLSLDSFVSYQGDVRGERLTLGFLRPTFLAEASLILLYAASADYQIKLRWRRISNTEKIWHFTILVAAVLIIILTGSRAAIGAVIIFLLGNYYYNIGRGWRPFVRGVYLTTIVVLIFVIVMALPDATEVNRISSGRIFIWIAEMEANLQTTSQWIFGNYGAQEAFVYSTERTGSVYHMDSFFLERIILNGVFGLILISTSIFLFFRRSAPMGKAIVYSCIFYGMFENSVFNITSAFSFFPLLIAALISSKYCLSGQRSLESKA